MRRRKMTLLPPSRDPWPALLGEEDLKLKRQYEARGGDFMTLLRIEGELQPRPKLDMGRRYKSRLGRVVKSVKEFLAQPDLPHWQLDIFNMIDMHVRRIWGIYYGDSVTMPEPGGESVLSTLTSLGERRDRVSVVAAILAEEFRQRFGRPRYRDILRRIEAALPGQFRGTNDPMEALRQRILSVPAHTVKEYHAQLFSHRKRRKPHK